ncbi:integral membrane protein [Sclerotinia borealis F-4128]|uniref:Integral membrane protein n=1 Tax=Sclerotinia borealis (strain F-4128) TaxID=1432307 RepID=W9CQ84_SCLBF|nr:integral membrane protein [Sclerotinia borealis F-4128]
MQANALSELSNSSLAWLATTIPLLFIAVIAVTSRVASQHGNLKKVDAGFLIALGFVIAQEIVGCVGILIWGLDNNAAILSPEKAQNTTMCLYISQIFYQTTIATNKISLLFFYLDILSTPSLRSIYHIASKSVFLSIIAFDTATIFQCTPIPYIWNRTSANGYCVNISALSITHAATNTFFYLLLFSLSLPIIHPLQLSTSQRYALACAYLLGCLVLTTSILNLTALIPPAPQKAPNTQILLTYSLESLLGLLLLSLLTIHTQITHLFTTLSNLLSSLPSLPPLPHLTNSIPIPLTTPQPPVALTRFPPTSAWKTLKSHSSFISRSSKYSSQYSHSQNSHNSHHSNLTSGVARAGVDVDDEMMVYVTVLGEPMENIL